MCMLHSFRHATLASGLLASLALSVPAAGQCQSKLLASDGVGGDDFGRSIDLDGDVMAVGSPFTDGANGAVYIFERQSGEWVETHKVQGSETSGSNNLGHDLDLEGDLLLAGAPRDDALARNSGVGYVFRFDGTTWVEEARLSDPTPEANQLLGSAVSLEGDVAVLGAPSDDEAGGGAGAAFVYRFDGSVWNFEQKLMASDAAGGDLYGSDVEMRGGTIFVGSIFADAASETRTGKVYIYERVAGSWVEQQVLEAADAERNAEFGGSISVFDDVAVIGAPRDDEAAGNAGAAYVFRFDGSSWNEEQKLVGSDTASADDFGAASSYNGQRLIVGAPFYDDLGQGIDNAGAAYVFKFESGSWVEESRLVAFDPETFNLYGSAVALVGTDAIVGSVNADTLSDPDVGAVYGLDFTVEAGWENYGTGHPGTSGVPAITLSADPIVGETVDLQVGNSLGARTSGFLFIGFDDLNITTNRDGILLVEPWRIEVFPVPPSGLTLPFFLECVDGLAGISVYVQMIQADGGASKGFSFTPGLRMDLGTF